MGICCHIHPDLALSDHHLFHAIHNSLKGKIFNDAVYVKSHLIQFFAGKNQKFYEHIIMTLFERWQFVIDKNRQYLIEESYIFKQKLKISFLFKNHNHFLAG